MLDGDRYIVLYETPATHAWKAHHTVTKAVIVWDDPEDLSMPYGFWADYLGPDEDVVSGITAIIPIHRNDINPTVVIDDLRYRFTVTGAPELIDESVHG